MILEDLKIRDRQTCPGVIDHFRNNMAAYFVKLLRTKLFGSTKGSKKTHSEEDLERTQRRHVVPFPEDMTLYTGSPQQSTDNTKTSTTDTSIRAISSTMDSASSTSPTETTNRGLAIVATTSPTEATNGGAAILARLLRQLPPGALPAVSLRLDGTLDYSCPRQHCQMTRE